MRSFVRWISALVLALTLPAAGGAELRSYTLTNGQTAKATLVGLTGNQVSLILENGRLVTVDLSRLSQADQSYIKMNAPGVRSEVMTTTPIAPAAPSRGGATGSVKLTWTKNRIGDKVQATNKDIINAPKTETWKCQFELTNSSRLRLENLDVHYEVFLRMKSRTGEESSTGLSGRTVTGTINVPVLDGFRSVKMETEEMKTSGYASKMIFIDSETRRSYDSGTRSLSMEEIEGVVVTVRQKGTLVLRYVSPGMRDTEGR